MAITTEDVEHIADLARLSFEPEEQEKMAGEMSKILEFMEQLEEVDTGNVAPLEHVMEQHAKLREDKIGTPLTHEEALKNAPDADSDYFRVPRVIE